MHYLSPATLFGPTFRPPFDIKTIQRERKKLLAELELSGGEVLNHNGQQFTKNELLGYFEELEQENIAYYHSLVNEDAVLVQFLEKKSIVPGARFKEGYNDPAFITWLSPYFYSAFTAFVAKCFDHPDAAAMRALLDNQLPITGRDKERAWLLIGNILEKNIALFDHYRGRGQKKSPKPMPIKRVLHFLGYAYVQVIKQLPDSQFSGHKDNYAHNMQHPAIATFNRDPHNRSIAVIWVETALDLASSPSVKKRIQEKLSELTRIQKKNRRRNYVLMFYGLVLVIGMIKALIDTEDHNPRSILTPPVVLDTAAVAPVVTPPARGVDSPAMKPDTVVILNQKAAAPSR
jgi:hypothetical protein